MIRIIFIILFFINFTCAETIKIGIAGPFSGTYVAAGDQQWLGAIQAVDDINQQGGINGKKLELVTADDACTPKKAAKIAQRFVQSNDIRAVIGHNCSATTLAADNIYGEANMLMITPASTAADITEHNYNSIFRTCGRDDNQGKIAAEFIVQQLKAQKIAIVHDDSLYGKGIANNTKIALEKLGIQPILYQKASKDLIKQISQLKPDLIYFGGLHIDAGVFLKQLRETGNKTIFFASDGIASPDFVQAAGGQHYVKDVFMTFSNDSPSNSQAKKVVKNFKAQGINATGYTLTSYAAVQAIAAAMQNTTYDKMSDWLHENKVDSVIGTLEWDKKGDLKKNPFIVYKWNDEGQYKPYWFPSST